MNEIYKLAGECAPGPHSAMTKRDNEFLINHWKNRKKLKPRRKGRSIRIELFFYLSKIQSTSQNDVISYLKFIFLSILNKFYS